MVRSTCPGNALSALLKSSDCQQNCPTLMSILEHATAKIFWASGHSRIAVYWKKHWTFSWVDLCKAVQLTICFHYRKICVIFDIPNKKCLPLLILVWVPGFASCHSVSTVFAVVRKTLDKSAFHLVLTLKNFFIWGDGISFSWNVVFSEDKREFLFFVWHFGLPAEGSVCYSKIMCWLTGQSFDAVTVVSA